MVKIKIYLALLIAVGLLTVGFQYSKDSSDKLILPKLSNEDSQCVVDNTHFLDNLQQDKLVIFLNFDSKESKNDFFKWVELSNKIAEQIAIKTIIYIYLSNCNSAYLYDLKRSSIINDDLFVLIDRKMEFLTANHIGGISTFSALLDHENELILTSKKNINNALFQKYEEKVRELLDLDLPFVDSWENPALKFRVVPE